MAGNSKGKTAMLQIFGIPVTVRPSFLALAAIVSWPMAKGSWTLGLVSALAVFLTLLVHELGHAFAARKNGLKPTITLYLFGGFVTWPLEPEPPSPSALCQVYFGGPALQILAAILSAVAMIILTVMGTPSSSHAFNFFKIFSVFGATWGILNLLPIFPLDGGRLLQLGLQRLRVQNARVWTLRVALILGVLLVSSLGFRVMSDGGTVGRYYDLIVCSLVCYVNFSLYKRLRKFKSEQPPPSHVLNVPNPPCPNRAEPAPESLPSTL